MTGMHTNPSCMHTKPDSTPACPQQTVSQSRLRALCHPWALQMSILPNLLLGKDLMQGDKEAACGPCQPSPITGLRLTSC